MVAESTGSPDTTLVCVRGNSGSGKSSIVRELRRRHGRGCALVEQDYLRRILLRERDLPGRRTRPDRTDCSVRPRPRHHVVLEGIMHSIRYRSMLIALRDGHRGRSLFCYLDVSLAETLRRHLTRPQASEFTAEHMSGWYAAHDVLGWPDELVLPETTGLNEAVAVITAAAGLSQTGRDDDLLPNVQCV